MTYVPPEWAPHKAIWTAWPSRPDLWPDILDQTRREVAAMVHALAKGDHLNVLVSPGEAEASAREALKEDAITIIPVPVGDIWFRDIAPIFARDEDKPVALTFRINGWGGKYIYAEDFKIAGFIAEKSATPVIPHNMVLEGGAVEFDGQGRMMTTRSCLLNPNRNPSLNFDKIEDNLREAFGVHQILWLDQGLKNDHTDGHIDNIARFISGGVVVCQSPSGPDDPNTEVLRSLSADLKRSGLEVVHIPSPGRITYADGSIAPASHMNYVVGNKTVVVPSYEDYYSVEAVAHLRRFFPGREVVALPAQHILTGGGSFHCITQQEPL